MTIKSSFLFLSLCSFASASELFSSNNGSTGIFETPNARIMPDWHMRTFFNINEPYKNYGLSVTPFPFLETNFHVTQIDENLGSSDYKDKSINFKLLLKKEGKYSPAIVLGGEDIWGDALFTSKYVAASKKIGYFDFTLGYAKGRLAGEKINSTKNGNKAFTFIRKAKLSDGKAFGSIVFNARPNLFLMAEYSPIDYSNDYVNAFDGSRGTKYKSSESDVNFGLKYKVNDNSMVSLSYERGNTVSFTYSYQFGFEKAGSIRNESYIKWKADKETKKEYKNLNNKELSDKLANEIASKNIRDVKIAVNENKIWSEIENSRNINDLKPVGKVLSIIDEVAPKEYDTIYVAQKDRDATIRAVKVNRAEFDLYENNKLSDTYMKKAISINENINESYDDFSSSKSGIYKSENKGFQRFDYYLGPLFETYLNSSSYKPIAVKASIQAKLDIDLGNGFYLNTNLQQPLYNNIDSLQDASIEEYSSSKLNLVDYFMYDKTQLKRLTLSHVHNLPYNILGKVEFGYFDLAYAGLDLEIAKKFLNERLTLGLQYQKMKKRSVTNLFKLHEEEFNFDAKFLNVSYLLSPKYNMFLGVKVGQFLDGDKGFKIDFSRSYKNFTLGAFATFTDHDEIFKNIESKSHVDKGVYIKFPFDVLKYKNIKGMFNHELSPWQTDSGRFANTSYNLFKMNSNENNSSLIKKDIKYLKH